MNIHLSPSAIASFTTPTRWTFAYPPPIREGARLHFYFRRIRIASVKRVSRITRENNRYVASWRAADFVDLRGKFEEQQS